MAINDVEVHKVDEEKREVVFKEALQELGPPDGSVLLQFDDVIGADLNEIVDEHFLQQLKEELSGQIGDLRFVKFVNEMIWAQFANYKNALEAENMKTIGKLVKISFEKVSLFFTFLDVCGHTLTISLKNPQWRATLDKELELCSAKTIPLCNATKELQNLSRETKRHNLSQLSQLSFEELGGKKRYIHVFQSNLSKSNV